MPNKNTERVPLPKSIKIAAWGMMIFFGMMALIMIGFAIYLGSFPWIGPMVSVGLFLISTLLFYCLLFTSLFFLGLSLLRMRKMWVWKAALAELLFCWLLVLGLPYFFSFLPLLIFPFFIGIIIIPIFIYHLVKGRRDFLSTIKPLRN